MVIRALFARVGDDMTEAGTSNAIGSPRNFARALAAAALCIATGACSQLSPGQHDLASASLPKSEAAKAPSGSTKEELAKATEYWGKEFAKNPKDAQSALSYARNLKAMGEKRQALAVLQQASLFHPGHRSLNSEYGRLALEFDQVSVAQRLLEQADDPTNPDWRVISARGTVLAKQGRYRDAIPLYERALALAPDQASVLNNLALAHAMEGHPDKAEPLLKRAQSAAGQDTRVSQNLALVLGLQGRYDEARLAAASNQSVDNAAANVDYVRRIVMLDPQPAPAASPAPADAAKRPNLRGPLTDGTSGGWTPQVAVAPAKR